MTVWPSMASGPLGRALGRLYDIRLGWYIFTVGNLAALLTIPIALPLFFVPLLGGLLRELPLIGPAFGWLPNTHRYSLTNRRIRILGGLSAREEKSLPLDGFDEILVEVQPGQAWHHAGNLLFRRSGQEVLRLAGILRPDMFRRTCLDAQRGYRNLSSLSARHTAPGSADPR